MVPQVAGEVGQCFAVVEAISPLLQSFGGLTHHRQRKTADPLGLIEWARVR
ncbi:hypothetical protein [Oscillatoria sp. FACHB-1407]|uniref:hypothetical protein n=1 Tax=Oscillatoria sp. FACHB-1407 TaxID=2692847 RepID=UPI0030D7E722